MKLLNKGSSVITPPKRGAGFVVHPRKAKREAIVGYIADELDGIQHPGARTIIERGLQEVSSEADAVSLLETLRLLRSSKNAERLLTALQRAKSETLKPQSPEDLRQEFGLVKED